MGRSSQPRKPESTSVGIHATRAAFPSVSTAVTSAASAAIRRQRRDAEGCWSAAERDTRRRTSRTAAATSHAAASSAAVPKTPHCHGAGPPATRTSRRLRHVGTGPRRSSVSPLSARNRSGATSTRRWRTSDPVSSTSKYGTPASTTNRSGGPVGPSTPHAGRSVGAGVGRPAGGLIARRGHGGVGDEVRHPGRGLEQPVRVVDRRPRRQRKQPIAIHARLGDEVSQDRQREVSLELVILGVGQDRDPDL